MLVHGDESRITESIITRIKISGFGDGKAQEFIPVPGVDWKLEIWFDHVHPDDSRK
jgi:hypothetical protein